MHGLCITSCLQVPGLPSFGDEQQCKPNKPFLPNLRVVMAFHHSNTNPKTPMNWACINDWNRLVNWPMSKGAGCQASWPVLDSWNSLGRRGNWLHKPVQPPCEPHGTCPSTHESISIFYSWRLEMLCHMLYNLRNWGNQAKHSRVFFSVIRNRWVFNVTEGKKKKTKTLQSKVFQKDVGIQLLKPIFFPQNIQIFWAEHSSENPTWLTGLTCSVPGYTLKLGMFSGFKAQNL